MQLPPAKRNPPARRDIAMTLLEMLVVIACLIVIAGLLLPALAKAKAKHARIGCVQNLKRIGMAFKMWGDDNNDKYPMQVSVTNGGTMELIASGNVFPHFQVMSNELNDPRILLCPNDTEREAATNFDSFNNDKYVSYFVGVDADQTNPAAILAGDRNLEIDRKPLAHGMNLVNSKSLIGWTSKIHREQGNFALADGSVQQSSGSSLRAQLQAAGLATNRLVLP